MPGRAGKQSGERALAGADLEDGVLRHVAERGDDATAGICIYQEVLTETGFLLHL
jgi:hypothetical protein